MTKEEISKLPYKDDVTIIEGNVIKTSFSKFDIGRLE